MKAQVSGRADRRSKGQIVPDTGLTQLPTLPAVDGTGGHWFPLVDS